MRSTGRRTLAGIVAAIMLAAPAAQARPADPAQETRAVEVAPPPSSIAAGSGTAYQELRAPQGRQQDLRSPDARDAAAGVRTATVESPPVVELAPAAGGLNWVTPEMGVLGAAGLALLLWSALTVRQAAARRAADG
jgi:hypothetical protein